MCNLNVTAVCDTWLLWSQTSICILGCLIWNTYTLEWLVFNYLINLPKILLSHVIYFLINFQSIFMWFKILNSNYLVNTEDRQFICVIFFCSTSLWTSCFPLTRSHNTNSSPNKPCKYIPYLSSSVPGYLPDFTGTQIIFILEDLAENISPYLIFPFFTHFT